MLLHMDVLSDFILFLFSKKIQDDHHDVIIAKCFDLLEIVYKYSYWCTY